MNSSFDLALSMLEEDESAVGYGRLTQTKSHNGPDGEIAIRLKARTLYAVQKMMEDLVGREGSFIEKRALVLWLEDIRVAVGEANNLQARQDLLQSRGTKAPPRAKAD